MKFISSAILTLLTVSFVSCNQAISPQDLPPALTSGLLTTFPDATDVSWEKEGDNFEADFIVDQKEHEALFSSSGTILMYKHDIAETELPEAIRTALTQNYNGQKTEDYAKFFKDGSEYYQIEVENANKFFSPDGQEQNIATDWD